MENIGMGGSSEAYEKAVNIVNDNFILGDGWQIVVEESSYCRGTVIKFNIIRLGKARHLYIDSRAITKRYVVDSLTAEMCGIVKCEFRKSLALL